MKKKGMLIFTFLMLLCNTLTMYYVNRALKQEINIYVVQVGRYKEKANAENTMKQIEEDLKLVDIIIEILDARIPVSSRNPQVQKLIKNKKKIKIYVRQSGMRSQVWCLRQQQKILLCMWIVMKI